MNQNSRNFQVRIKGPIACFTRPEMKVERVSYEVMTPSAARGILESILWKPAISWNICQIAVLSPISWLSFRRNEVNQLAIANSNGFFIEERRAQRNTVALRDVDYIVTAFMKLTPRAGREDSIPKFEDMFQRRLQKGQHFQQPYLGCREFAAHVEEAPQTFDTIEKNVDRPLGLLFYDFEYPSKSKSKKTKPAKPLFFDARLKEGVLHVPPLEQVLKNNQIPGGKP